MQEPRFFASGTPFIGKTFLSLGKRRKLWWFLPIIKKLVERNVHGSREFFQGFDRWNRMPIFYARDITTKQSRFALDVPLRNAFLFPNLL